MIDQALYRPFRPLMIVGAVLVLTGLMMGCGDDDESSSSAAAEHQEFDFNLEIETHAMDGTPVAGIPIVLDDNVVGFSDANGQFTATLRDRPGREIELSVEEIEGYALTSDDFPRTEKLQLTRSLEGNYRGVPINLEAQVRTTLLEYLTWVDLECDSRLDDEHCADVPILIDGEEKARTNHRGIAHFTFEGIPGEEHELTVVTDNDSVTIEPSNPTYQIELERKAMIFHIDQEFSDPDARSRPRPRPRPRPQPRPQPQPQPDPEPDDDDGGVIPLF